MSSFVNGATDLILSQLLRCQDEADHGLEVYILPRLFAAEQETAKAELAHKDEQVVGRMNI